MKRGCDVKNLVFESSWCADILQVVKKLAGKSAATAFWCTNVGNESGQVLTSVLTDKEGQGLADMVEGLIRRYKDANVPAPVLLYTDRDCCPNSGLRKMFRAWPDTMFRLDIWHFMRRFTVGCTTDAHQLYQTFLSRLSQCIFEYSGEDLDALIAAKRSEMELVSIRTPSDSDVLRHISKKELALHCRRQTRGVETTTRLIHELLLAFDGEQGRDSLGVPLLNSQKMWAIWETLKPHIACIQDPEGERQVQLYTETGTVLKGSIRLPVFRCARGSTSLESFHLHLNRFIPGKSKFDFAGFLLLVFSARFVLAVKV